jgi:phosphomannomutase
LVYLTDNDKVIILDIVSKKPFASQPSTLKVIIFRTGITNFDEKRLDGNVESVTLDLLNYLESSGTDTNGKDYLLTFLKIIIDRKYNYITDVSASSIIRTIIKKYDLKTEDFHSSDSIIKQKINGNEYFICSHMLEFEEKYEQLLLNKLSLQEFFNILSLPLFKFTQDSQNKVIHGSVPVDSLHSLFINLSTLLKEINDSENIRDLAKANIDKNQAKSVSGKIIEKLKEICI